MKLLSVSDGPEEKVITVRRSLIKPWLLLNTQNSFSAHSGSGTAKITKEKLQ